MEQKNRYLKITGVAGFKMQEFEREKLGHNVKKIEISTIIEHYLEDNRGIRLNSEGRTALGFAVSDLLLQEKPVGIQLQMLELSDAEAQEDIKYLRNKGIVAVIQYRNSEVTTTQSNDCALNVSASDIMSDGNKLKQYLKDIYSLEKELYCLKKVRENIIGKMNGLGIPRNRNVISKPDFLLTILLFAGIGFVIGFIFDSDACVLGGAIGAVIGVYKGYKAQVEYKREYSRIQSNIRADEERVELELGLVSKYEKIEQEIRDSITSCEQILGRLYSLDIIFPKYRNFIAIAQFYEYYMSGRCTKLEGHEGAYNIFENELRQNIIILQLNEVLNQLEQIKQNQFMIYQAIQESNRLLDSIEKNTSITAYNTSVIAENTAISARYY